MVSKLENPPLLVLVALRFHGPFGLLFFLGGRWRRFLRAVRQAPGLMLYQRLWEPPGRWLLPTTFLILTWWESRETLKAWNNHPEHQRMIGWAKGQTDRFDFWLEEYFLKEPGQYLGGAGGLKAVEGGMGR